MKAKLYTADGKISTEIYQVEESSIDRKGNLLLIRDAKKFRVHPSRILFIDGEVPVQKHGEDLFANCPDCNNEQHIQIGQYRVECKCRKVFNVSWQKLSGQVIKSVPKEVILKQNPRSKGRAIMKQYKIPIAIDFPATKLTGELWTKIATFDHPEFDVKAHVLLIVNVAPRKFCFNSYNGTWGKKSREAELNAFIKNESLNNNPVGYSIKNEVDKERKKLERQGYQRET